MKNKKSKFGLGLLLTGLAAGAGAVAYAVFKQKKREEVYHEAELKAMNELDDLINECDSAECEGCSCAEECAQVDSEVGEQETFDEVIEQSGDENDDEPEVEVEVITDADDEQV